MLGDMEAIIKDTNTVLGEAAVKSYMHMLLSALAACHERWVVHRWGGGARKHVYVGRPVCVSEGGEH